ncbi:hypothetical protein [Shinella kummerowiae]|uniref:hypothetical protein n=1 Tax=Shinella kummerowiae TaxID=417745 RepID=UPI0021B542DF|nr:hypothetical protein [Shinella kummerowiae]MCT7665663.1 hypothetical protein [Shinella kummerowiae]
MRLRFAMAILVAAGPAFAAQPTEEQKEMRAGLLRVTLAEECRKITGDEQIVTDAISALRITAERNFPGSADIASKINAFVKNEGNREKPSSGLVTPTTCKRVRSSIDAIINP